MEKTDRELGIVVPGGAEGKPQLADCRNSQGEVLIQIIGKTWSNLLESLTGRCMIELTIGGVTEKEQAGAELCQAQH